MRMIAVKGRRRERRRRGFMVMLVFAAMIYIAGAVVVMSTLFAHEARRTRSVVAGAQLRELLLASVPAAAAELAAHGVAAREVAVNTPVEGATLKMQVAAGAAGGAEVLAQAEYRGYRMAQRVRFTGGAGAGGGWKVVDVTLTQTGLE